MVKYHAFFSAVLLLLPRLAHFSWRVLHHFLKNRGILIAGGVGYNILLSIVPLFALLVVLLTQVVDEQHLLNVLTVQARHMAPAHAEMLLEAVGIAALRLYAGTGGRPDGPYAGGHAGQFS